MKQAILCVVLGVFISTGEPSFGAMRPAESSGAKARQRDWPVTGGAAENQHYSNLTQINRQSVNQLRVAWSFDTGESGGLQTTPIVVDGVLYGYTPSQKVFALNAATGKLLWKFDAGVNGWQPNRGLTYWTDGKEKRIFAAVMNLIYALDATTGKVIPTFAEGGRIDLRRDLGRPPETLSISLTSPGVVYEDLFIVGGRLAETLPSAPGDVRAYDVRTGKLRWSFHTIPHPGEFGYETWAKDSWKSSGGANNWAGMAVDAKRGIVYVPTGSAAFDFYGADRPGDNLFANSLIALNARTGKRLWHFQGVRHDMWDRDFPAAPTLVTLKRAGKTLDAVAQTSKQGFVFVFDRTNGEPLFPIEYRKVPASEVPGERAATEQPVPTKPRPFARQLLTEDLLTNRSPAAHAWAIEQFRQFRSEGPFVPFSVGKETVMFPGFDGGAEWGGSAWDPDTGVLYVNANEVAWTGSLIENVGDAGSGRGLYQAQCSMCHRDNMAGSPPTIPSLAGVADRLGRTAFITTVTQGRGRMPAFPGLSVDQMFLLFDYVMSGESKELASSTAALNPLKYRFAGYKKFLDPDGYPAVAPPWGTLNAIDLSTGETVWQIPLGEYPELAAAGKKNTGSENYGGPLVTAGGVLFIGASIFDKKFRAFDKATGELLYAAELPFAGNATPVTYEVNNCQHVVIAAGGGKNLKSPTGGVYVAFALPCGRSTARQ